MVIKEREGKVLIITIIIIIANHHDTILNVSCKDHMYICMNTYACMLVVLDGGQVM